MKKHQIWGDYRKRCQCVDCRSAWNNYVKAWRAEKRNVDPPKHGLSGYVGYGCRCPVCKEARQSYMRQYLYGVTQEEYADLLEVQGGACAICSEDMSSPRVDHDHSTGTVRGLLCPRCNMALGKFRDSTENIRNAISYLR